MINSGILYIRENDKITYKTVGFRDLANKIPINDTTRFPTASAGKVFVAVGILRLVEEEKITLDTTLSQIFDAPLGTIDMNVTVYQLLTHTSGIPSYADEEKYPNYADIWIDVPNYSIRTNRDLLPLFINEKMKETPGTVFRYNDSGFVLLGLIIEIITNLPMDVYLHQVIFAPLGMKYTGYYELDRLPENCANAYIWDDETQEYYTNIYSIDAKGSGAGGAYTNALDVALFWEGLLQYKLLSKDLTNHMLQRHQSLKKWGYGLGIWLDENNNPMFIGEDPGVSFMTHYNLKTTKQITIISNMQEDVYTLLDERK